MSETSKTAKIILFLVLYWAMDLIWLLLYPRPQYSTKMIFAVLDVSLIMGLNIGETDKNFYINICCFCRKNYQISPYCLMLWRRYDQNNLTQYGRRRHVEFIFGLHFDTFSRLGRQNAPEYQISCKSVNISRSYDISYIFKMASVRHLEF